MIRRSWILVGILQGDGLWAKTAGGIGVHDHKAKRGRRLETARMTASLGVPASCRSRISPAPLWRHIVFVIVPWVHGTHVLPSVDTSVFHVQILPSAESEPSVLAL